MPSRSRENPVLTATKNGASLVFDRDPAPGTVEYMVIASPDLLVLFPKGRDPIDVLSDDDIEVEPLSGRSGPSAEECDVRLRHAFSVLDQRVQRSLWTNSEQPYSDLLAALRSLHEQDAVQADVATHLEGNPSVGSAVEMLFTSIAMSARADWQAVPFPARAVAARGWFLGRWIPTFLVLDGPILRFLKSPAFRRQTGSPSFLRAVRAFFSNKDFVALRHAIAHWSFGWRVDDEESEIVGHGLNSAEEVTMSLEEADAFHIITYAVVEVVHLVFLSQKAEPSSLDR